MTKVTSSPSLRVPLKWLLVVAIQALLTGWLLSTVGDRGTLGLLLGWLAGIGLLVISIRAGNAAIQQWAVEWMTAASVIERHRREHEQRVGRPA